jgi:hypothetical protein
MMIVACRRFDILFCLTVVVCLTGSPTAAQVRLPVTEFLPVSDGTPEQRSIPFGAWITDLSADGYVEQEYLVSGQANIYDYVDEAARSPVVEVTVADRPYTTRILVRRPRTSEEFNGTVYLEVLNPTFGFDVDLMWDFTFRSIIDAGAAYVGVTSKPVAAEFLRDDWGSTLGKEPLPPRNNSRYASLDFPLIGQVWDILSQVGALLKSDAIEDNPLTGFGVQRVIMVGFSQSAGYQKTYVNSFHDNAHMPGGKPVYDGYYISGGTFGAKRVNPPDLKRPNHPAGDPRTLLPVPLSVPVIRFQTQSEMLPFSNADTVRQTEADDPLIRTYELAGAPHLDLDNDEFSGPFLLRDLGIPDLHGPCASRFSPIRNGPVQSALLRVLEVWIQAGTTPPASRMIQIGRDDRGRRIVEVDVNGNALGGVPHPMVEVPRGTYLAHNAPTSCFLTGTFIEFEAATLKTLYPDSEVYLQQVRHAVSRAISDRFLLPQSRPTIMRQALQHAGGT